MPRKSSARAFKTAWFGKAAKKARIGDPTLMAAILEVMRGQADDLGGGVFKKRLNENMHRSIVLAKGGQHWVFAYLFAKKYRSRRARCFQEARAGLRSHDGCRVGIRTESR
jgi:hypothetical protein